MSSVGVCAPAIDTQRACDGHSETDLVHYCIVRADLPHGSQVAQIIHAAGESTPTRVPENTVAVALHARNQTHLLEIRETLQKAGISHVLISECDGEPMSIGIEPTRDRSSIRKVTSSLPLVR